MALNRALADTSVFVAQESVHRLSAQGIPPITVVSVVSLAELRAGVLSARDAMTRDRRLETLATAQALQVLVIDEAVAAAWARLRLFLRDSGRRMPVNDSWIAATALAGELAILTQDDDFDAIHGFADLAVIKV